MFYTFHHIVKTYLAIASSLIIADGKFEPNYSKTVKKCKEIYGKKFPDLIKKIEWALRMKLYPKREVKDIKRKWFEAAEDLIFVLKYISEKNYRIKAKGIKELTRKLYKKLPYVYFNEYLPLPKFLKKIIFPSQYFLNLLYFKRTWKFRVLFSWRDIGLRIAMTAFILLKAREDKELLKEAYDHIRRFADVKDNSWKNLRTSFLYGFDKYYSQKII